MARVYRPDCPNLLLQVTSFDVFVLLLCERPWERVTCFQLPVTKLRLHGSQQILKKILELRLCTKQNQNQAAKIRVIIMSTVFDATEYMRYSKVIQGHLAYKTTRFDFHVQPNLRCNFLHLYTKKCKYLYISIIHEMKTKYMR